MVHRIEIASNGPASHNLVVSVYFDSQNLVEVDLDANIRNLLTGPDRNDPNAINITASDWLQMLVDAGRPSNPGRILLTDLHPEDLDRIDDPAQPHNFHARIHPESELGQGQNTVDIWRPVALVGGVATHLIGRPFLVNFIWDDTDYTIRTETPPRSLR